MQVFVVHGGGTFATHERFLEYLKTGKVEIEKDEHRDWKQKLQASLGDEFEVIRPTMPNKQNAQYEEWRIWFERHIEFIQDGVVLVGHSLGGAFLAKYISENDFPKQIKALFLVAAPYTGSVQNNLVQFAVPDSLEKLQNLEVHLFHSTDDAVVEYTEMKKYQSALPNAIVHTFKDRGHFNQEQFPELVEEIQKLA